MSDFTADAARQTANENGGAAYAPQSVGDDAPSMAKAALIRDVAARHAYVFDNGLCSPDFKDLEKRIGSEEFGLIVQHCDPRHWILEIGCFTGLNLLGLGMLNYRFLAGLDFVKGAIDWFKEQAGILELSLGAFHLEFPALQIGVLSNKSHDRVICFDVLEHQPNVGQFLVAVADLLKPGGQALFLVPEGANYNDCGHVAWFPNCDCLRNVLDYFFEVKEVRRLKDSAKLFAVCERRD